MGYDSERLGLVRAAAKHVRVALGVPKGEEGRGWHHDTIKLARRVFAECDNVERAALQNAVPAWLTTDIAWQMLGQVRAGHVVPAPAHRSPPVPAVAAPLGGISPGCATPCKAAFRWALIFGVVGRGGTYF